MRYLRRASEDVEKNGANGRPYEDVIIVDCGEVRVQSVCPSHCLYFDL